MKILGIDPGLNFTGWAVIEENKSEIELLDFGIITPNNKDSTSLRLHHIYTYLNKVIEEFTPACVSLEEIFVNSDPRSALKLGYARGVALMIPSIYDLQVFEYAPTVIKKVVCGNGHSSKDQVCNMVKLLIPKHSEIIEEAKDDAVDAIAIALCHLFHQNLLNKQ
jgi:crossover junction endodeoxyribonuclease RuvC